MQLGFTTWSMVTVRAEEGIPLLAGIGYDCIELAVVPGWRDGVDLLTPSRRRRIKQLLGDVRYRPGGRGRQHRPAGR